jgi:hypothetical protein
VHLFRVENVDDFAHFLDGTINGILSQERAVRL